MEDKEISKLVKQIENAFADTPYPGKNIGDDGEVGRFIGKRWKDVTREDINSNDHLSFFTLDALRYYLPAYLIGVLRNPDLRLDIRLALIKFFDPGEDWKSNKPELLSKIFSEPEKAAIRSFFENYKQLFLLSKDEPFSSVEKKRREALARTIEYWQYYG